MNCFSNLTFLRVRFLQQSCETRMQFFCKRPAARLLTGGLGWVISRLMAEVFAAASQKGKPCIIVKL